MGSPAYGEPIFLSHVTSRTTIPLSGWLGPELNKNSRMANYKIPGYSLNCERFTTLIHQAGGVFTMAFKALLWYSFSTRI